MLRDSAFSASDYRIELTGRQTDLAAAFECLRSAVQAIRYSRIDALSKGPRASISMARNLLAIIKTCLGQSTRIASFAFKIQVQQSAAALVEAEDACAGASSFNRSMLDESGVFVAYFHDCVSLDEAYKRAFVFEQISQYLLSSLAHEEVNVTRYDNVFISPRWKAFERELLQPSVASNRMAWNLHRNYSGEQLILLTGIKEDVSLAKTKIEEFLSSNEYRKSVIDLAEEDVITIGLFRN